jgi:peptidyl-prolyl cis-trans isomerase B (cyclophilin B)
MIRKTLFILSFVLLATINASAQRVKIHTTMGDIVVRLYDETPVHRDNFLKLVREGYYDGTLFHRVIKGFMIQGGDPNSKGAAPDQMLGNGNPGYTLEAEFREGLYHKRGALAAAREDDATNPERRSSGSQFYIVWGRTFSPRQMEYLIDQMQMKHPETGGLTPAQREVYATYGGTPHLDGQYTVFGEVVEGLDVVEKIQNLPTNPADRPIDDVKVTMEIVE